MYNSINDIKWDFGSDRHFQRDVYDIMGKLRCGIIDEYMVVIVPSEFQTKQVQILDDSENNIKAMVVMEYLGEKFAATFPIPAKDINIVIVSVGAKKQ